MIIQELEKVYSVAKMADYLGVSRQGYWRWKRRQPTRLEMEDEVLLILNEASRYFLREFYHEQGAFSRTI